jgi:thiol-disulfide isomerase/thioredoxin
MIDARLHAGRILRSLVVLGALVVATGIAEVCLDIEFDTAEAAEIKCAHALDLASKLASLAKGELAALTMASKPVQLADTPFEDADGNTRKLSEWRGRVVLINLWATWCVPCRKEMPALDNLQGKLGSSRFQVAAINIDTRDRDKPKAFLKENHLSRLELFIDQKAAIFQNFKSIGLALGMPTSVIMDGEGCEIATIAGPAQWDSDDAVALITAATAL